MTGEEIVVTTWTVVNSASNNIVSQAASLLTGSNMLMNIFWGLLIGWTLWCVLWAFKDIATRTRNVAFQLLCGLIAGIPIIGLPIYFLLRPTRQLDDKDWRETTTFDYTLCPGCNTINNRNHNYCINCWNMLRTECKECKENFWLDFAYCPNCWGPNLALEELKRKK